jgi:superfamily II DNA or RNA helicase
MTTATRAVTVLRDGDHFRLVFAYDPRLVERARTLPYAQFCGDTRSWLTLVCDRSVEALRAWHYEGLLDVSPDDLLVDGEQVPVCRPATLGAGSRTRPFVVRTAWRDDTLFSRLRAVPTAAWDKGLGGLTFGPAAAAALADLVARGIVDDPDGVLHSAAVTVCFDVRSGGWRVLGDPRAQRSFDSNFPARDVVAEWKTRGHDVAFSDLFSEEVYRGEFARAHHTLQPAGLCEPLLDFQAKAVAVAVERSGVGMYLETGLGKTPLGVAIGHELRTNRRQVTRNVCVVPSTVRGQWEDEIVRFTGADATVVVVRGDAKRRHAAYEAAADADWLVVHYDVIAKDEKFLRPLVTGALLVLDEVHRVKSPTSKRTKTAHRLGRLAARRVGLTATPIESSPDEWFWVLEFLSPGALGNFDEFGNRYMFPNRWGFEGARNLPELRARSKPHFLRFTKKAVAPHLPPLRVEHLPIDPDGVHAAALRLAHQIAKDEIAAMHQRGAKTVFDGGLLDGDDWADAQAQAGMTAVSMLRALCASPRLVLESESPSAQALVAAGVVPDVDGPKVDTLRLMVGDLQAAGERVVIFTYSSRLAKLIAERFTADGIRWVLYTGDTSDKDREAARRRFNDPDDDVCAFIATDAAAEGLNLGRCCSTLINVDPPWTPTRLEQRSNRIHRVDGTAESYLVVNMSLRGTLEDGILRMIESKAQIADVLFGERRGRVTGRRGGGVSVRDLQAWFAANGDASSPTTTKVRAARQASADRPPRVGTRPADPQPLQLGLNLGERAPAAPPAPGSPVPACDDGPPEWLDRLCPPGEPPAGGTAQDQEPDGPALRAARPRRNGAPGVRLTGRVSYDGPHDAF